MLCAPYVLSFMQAGFASNPFASRLTAQCLKRLRHNDLRTAKAVLTEFVPKSCVNAYFSAHFPVACAVR